MRLTAANGWRRITGSCGRTRHVVPPECPPERGGDVVAQRRRSDAPRRRRPTTGSRGGSRSCPRPWPASAASRPAGVPPIWVGCQVASSTRVATSGAKRRTTSTGGWSAMMSQAAPQRRGRRRRVGRLERPRGQGGAPDPLDLERPQRVALLVEADEVERVRLERRLEEVRADGRPAWRGAAVVARRLVVDGHDAPLGPGLGQEPDVAR